MYKLFNISIELPTILTTKDSRSSGEVSKKVKYLVVLEDKKNKTILHIHDGAPPEELRQNLELGTVVVRDGLFQVVDRIAGLDLSEASDEFNAQRKEALLSALELTFWWI